jgi:alpha-tubulin suppressor-like RCC1 family protein
MKNITILLTFFSFLFANTSYSANYYWKNGTGNWSDTSHWSLLSGGPDALVIPSALDNVIFDAASGLTVLDTVYMDVPVDVINFNYSLVTNSFVFSSTLPSIQIQGSLTANGLTTYSWTGAIHMNPISNSSFTSNGFIWNNDIHLIGSDTLTLIDNYLSTADMFIDSGVIVATGINIGLDNFYSTFPSIRSILFDSTVLDLTGVNWDIDSTNVTFSNIGGTINLQNVDTTLFNGGFVSYDTVYVLNGNLTLFDDNSFAHLELQANSSILTLDNGSTQTIDSLVTNGDCFSPTLIQSLNSALASATIQKTGSLIFNGSHLSINNVDALSPGTEVYYISSSDTTNGAEGWINKGIAFYWINNSGNWSDPNHWSYSSNGASAGCIPQLQDSVYFDVNSFTLAAQQVQVDILASFSYMDWTGSANSTLKLTKDILSNGDVILHSNVFVTRDSLQRRIEFIGQAILSPDSAIIDCNISENMFISADSLLLNGFLQMTDSSIFALAKGKFYSQNNGINVGSIKVFQLPTLDIKLISFGSSIVNLSAGFDATGVTTNFTLNAGTSQVYIGSQGNTNFLLSPGLTFYNVTLEFPKLTVPQKVTGSNTFNKLKILKGSHVEFLAASTQTITDSLIILGNCKDSIYLRSSILASPAIFSKTAGAARGECLNLTSMRGQGGATFTAYFSTNNGGNIGWVFNATPATTSSFTANGPYCFGDTSLFTNTSTSFSGNPADITSYWYFGDNSTGYYANPPTDSTWIDYEIDTLQHSFITFGNFDVTLITEYTNFCVDTSVNVIRINYPDISVNISDFDTTICAGSPLSFDLNSSVIGAQYETFLNGISQNVPSLIDSTYQSTTFNHLDTISFLVYENGCVGPLNPTYSINVIALPTINWSSSDADTVICLNTPVTFTSTGTNVYQYFVNNLSVTGFIASGLYTTSTLANTNNVFVIGKDLSTGCRDTTTEMIFTVNPLPTTALSQSIVGNIICIGDAVTFTASGATQYQFFLNGVAVTPIGGNTWVVDSLSTGEVVSVMGYSAFGCSKLAAETFSYIVNPLPVPNLYISDSDTSICYGTNVTFSASGGALYEYFINNVSQGIQSSVSTISTSTLTNNDQIYVEVEFSGCRQNSDTVVFEVLTSPTTSLISDDLDASICAQTLVNFMASGATNYEFFVNNVSQGPSSPVSTFSSSTIGNGQSVSVIGESNTCSVSDVINFTVLNLPNVPLFSNDPDNTICFVGSITLSSANCATYELLLNGVPQGAPQISPSFNPILPVGLNSTQIIGTGSNGCSTASPVASIQVNPIPNVVLTSSDADNIICAGQSVTFTGSGSNQYQFFVNGVPQGSMSSTSTLVTNNLSNGQNISITGSSLGCISNSNILTFTVNTVPTVTLSSTDANNIFCGDATETFSAAGASDYEFFVNTVSQGAASPTNTFSSLGFPSGNYVIQVVGTQNNCSSSASSNVTINPLPVATINSSDIDNIICSGQNVNYTAGTGALYQFQINGVNQAVASPLAQASYSSLANGDIVSVIVSTSQGCTATATYAAITVNSSPIVTLSSSDVDLDICVGDAVTLTGSGANSYEFFINGNSQGTPSAVNTFNTTSLANNSNVTVVGSSSGCAATSNSLTFTVHNYPIVSVSNSGGNEICVGENVNITVLGANNYQFLVNGNPVGPFSATNTYTDPLNNGDVVSVNGETFGCISNASSSITFSVNTYPTITAVSSDADNVICLNELVTLTTSGAATYTYNLNGSPMQSAAATTFSTVDLIDGDVLSVTGFNGDCPSAPSSFTFTVNSMNLDLSVSASSLICAGESVTFTATGADLYMFYVNGTSQGALSPTATFTSSNLTNLDEVTYTGYSTSTMCTQLYQDYIVMNVLDQPVVTPLSSLTICAGDSVILVINYAYGNQWYLDGNPIVGATDTSFVAFTSGAYSLESTVGGNGTMWSFGLNAQGMFADSSNLNSTEPTLAQTTQVFDEVSSGEGFMLGVTTTGTVYAWGENSSGQLGNGTYTNSNIAINVPTLADIKTVATTQASSAAVTNTGAVYVWGNNIQGQLGTGNTAVINFPYQNASLANMDTIAGGKTHFVFLKLDGTVWTVGNNAYGQLGIGNLTNSISPVQVSGLANIVSVGAGEYSSFAINSAGDLYVWGNNGSGQLGLNDINNRLIPTVSPLKNVINAQGGANHTMFLTNQKKVFTSGGNVYGQLGTGDFFNRLTPTETNLSGVTMISSGQYNSLVLRADKSVYGFGNNLEDQLSSPNGVSINTPEHISDLNGVAFIEAGKSSSHVLTNESQSCVSVSVNVSMLSVPIITIIEANDILSATAGVAYQWYFNGNIIPGASNQTWAALSSGDYAVDVTFANGCTGTSPIFAFGFAGLEEWKNSFDVYPNPTSSVLYIHSTNTNSGDKTFVLVRDMAGRIVIEKTSFDTQTFQLDLSELVTGVYIVEVQTNNNTIGRKQIVKSN